MARNKHMNQWQQHRSRYTINHNIKHTYEDLCLHTILIWKNRFFEIEYIKLIQYSFPLMLLYRNVTLRCHISCRNMTLRSHNIVSKRDTPIQLSHSFVSSSVLYSRRYFNREGLRLEIQQSNNFRPTTNHSIKTYNHTIKYIGDFTISLNTYQSLFWVYLSHRNKP